MENNRKRICVCYLITTVLISAFIYNLISSNLQNKQILSRLREEVDEIAHVVLHSGPGSTDGQSKHLSELVDSILKKRLAGVWDDLYTVKKQLKASQCSKIGNAAQKGRDAVGERAEDRVNYVSEDLGAKIHSVTAEPVCGTNIIKSLFRLDFSSNPPINMLRSNMDPGNCFAFKNNKSEVTVKLAKEIFIESFEIEHITKAASPTADTTSAPRAFNIYAITSNSCDSGILLGSFEYENSPEHPVQLYSAKAPTKSKFVRFKFETNHGNPNYTCVYRVAVYGRIQ